MTRSPDDLAELLAAHAVGALDDRERRELEDALAADPSLQRQLADHLEVLAALAPVEQPPAELRARILGALPAPPRAVVAIGEARSSRQHRAGRIAGLVVAAAAVVALLVLGVGLVRADRPSDLAGLTEQALDDPAADQVTLALEDGAPVARAAVYPDGEGFLRVEALPALDESETYQLWMLPAGPGAGGNTDPISLGLVPGDVDAVAFRLDPGAAGLALSQEPAGGSVTPSEVVAAGTFG